ncbi:MAG TPA: MOSC N-terminal beta barrel domain-containing protein [Opitutaceae bacterium]|nr:MOSC N-terminal beta barrel domain-containing protein [Opitutaceae bacterium]
MHLAALHIHPVKSLRGLAVESAAVDPIGAVGDRRFLVADPSGLFLTQRTVPRMALVGAFLDDSTLTLRSDGFGEIRVRRLPDPRAPLVSVRVWSSEGLLAEDCGDAPASWLGGVLGAPCRLVRVGPAFSRPVKPERSRPGDLVGFADGYPFLAVSEGSLLDLNRRIERSGGRPVPMTRFRPNLVLGGCEPYAEDAWSRIRIGAIVFRVAAPCTRCVITTTDQATGERGAEPLRTLARYRRNREEPTLVNFGQNLIHEVKSGLLRVGDPVEILG